LAEMTRVKVGRIKLPPRAAAEALSREEVTEMTKVSTVVQVGKGKNAATWQHASLSLLEVPWRNLRVSR
jgi:hypothetical protein